MKQRTITLTITDEDAASERQLPVAWGWRTVLDLVLHGHVPVSVKVGTHGPAKAVGNLPEEAR